MKASVRSISQASVGRITAASSPSGLRMGMGSLRGSSLGSPSFWISLTPVKLKFMISR